MVSVAMCTYNGEKFIKAQLESILAQTHVPDEIIICDDCSQDSTIDIVSSILKSWNGRYKIIVNQSNLGFKRNFAKAISLCTGDIIFLADQDDVWESCKIDVISKIFQNHNDISLIFHDVVIVDEKLNIMASSFWQRLHFDYQVINHGQYNRLLYSNIVQGSACAFRKEVCESAIPFYPQAIHDEWIALNSLLHGRIYAVPMKLNKYRQSGSNALGAVSISDKVIKWLSNINHSLDNYFRESLRRYQVLKMFRKKKAVYEGQYINYKIFDNYLSFFKRKIVYLNEKNIKLIFMIPDYMLNAPTVWWGIRMYCEDLLLFIKR